ncbi:MAG: hypothetical protein WD766_07420 [Gemmatimonadota bacterium]
MRRNDQPEDERQKLFRKMEWVFVYGPPLMAVFIGVFGSLFLAAVVPLEGTTFLGRWLLAVLVTLVLPAVVYVVRYYLKK